MALRKSFSLGWAKNKGKEQKKQEKKVIVTEKDPFVDIAAKMIEKELELEKRIDPVIIHELITLYSGAVEHYSLKNDSKCIDYQIRMQNMLKRPEVLRSLKIENSLKNDKKVANIVEPPKNLKNIHNPQEKAQIHTENLSEIKEIHPSVEAVIIEPKEKKENERKSLEFELPPHFDFHSKSPIERAHI